MQFEKTYTHEFFKDFKFFFFSGGANDPPVHGIKKCLDVCATL
jgi:hypothetical protein